MRPAYYVKLPKSVTPKFPPVCVSCGAPPSSNVSMFSEAVGWWSFARFGSLYGVATGRAVQFPACAACGGRLRRERWIRTTLEWGLAIIGVMIGLWLFREWEGLYRRIAVLGVAVVIALPYVLWDSMFPPAVDIVVTDQHVTFYFSDQAYADQFAAANPILE